MHPASLTFEQLDAQLFFQGADALGDGRLADMKFLGRGREGVEFSSGDKHL